MRKILTLPLGRTVQQRIKLFNSSSSVVQKFKPLLPQSFFCVYYLVILLCPCLITLSEYLILWLAPNFFCCCHEFCFALTNMTFLCVNSVMTRYTSCVLFVSIILSGTVYAYPSFSSGMPNTQFQCCPTKSSSDDISSLVIYNLCYFSIILDKLCNDHQVQVTQQAYQK